ncbi:16S rRNA (adenine(1518)-N(6)/adenine(1519)-N(6))-dimethyltransferase RsmA [Marinibaculum pumilum]|uniref:Ribosomal RNA small subunit methyltransferase A n=1 Tax=Marinibaculum pumilum TaxID=1766165 RepID=A0ABV7KU89_9PROT
MPPESDNGPSAPALPPLREVIAAHGLTATKALGQNFLLDLNLTAKIARAAAPLTGFTVYEVGPGPGGLTRALLAQGADRVVAVERDRRFIAALDHLQAAYPDRLTLVEADALQADEEALLAGAPAKLVANLPYNIATPLLLRWFAKCELFDSLTVMVQREVADRMTAAPGTRAFGRLGVATQWRMQARRLFDLPASAFVPPPKVTSTVVQLIPRPAPLAPARPDLLERVTQAAFGQRRKMLRSALRSLGTDPVPLLAAAGIAPECRAEELSIEAFCALAEALRRQGA